MNQRSTEHATACHCFYTDNPELHELFAAQAKDFVVQDQVSGLIWATIWCPPPLQFLLLCIYQHVSRCISSQPVDKL